MTGKSWFISQNGKEIFILSRMPTKPPTQWVSEALCPGIQQPRYASGHSSPSSDEFKNAWRYISIASYA
jgi:hypothetical protein